MTQTMELHDDAIAKIAKEVVARLEPLLDQKFSDLDDRLAKLELSTAPTAGRTVHDIKNHLAIGATDLERLADSYEKLSELLNQSFANHQAGLRLQRRMDEFQDKMRVRMNEVETTVETVRDEVTRKAGMLAPPPDEPDA